MLALVLVAGNTLSVASNGGVEEALTLSATLAYRTIVTSTDGTVVIWNAPRADRGWDVVVLDLGTRRLRTLTPGPPRSYFSGGVDRGFVVWRVAPSLSEAGRVEVHDLPAGRTTTIARGRIDNAALAWPWVVWTEIEGGVQVIKARDLRPPERPPVVVRRGTEGFSVTGDRVTWLEVDRGERPGLTPETWRLYTQPIDTAAPVLVDEGLSGGIDGPVNKPSSYVAVGDRVVYILGDATGSLIVTDLRTRKRLSLGLHGEVSSFTIDGRYVFYTHGRSGRGIRVELWGYDLVTDTRFLVRNDVGAFGGFPSAKGGILAWTQASSEQSTEVHAAPIAAVLPTGRRAPLSISLNEARYFPETGHNLILGFRSFWGQSGGLPVFGYPLTEEIQQFQRLDSSTGIMLTIQFFERQRFEYHPELAGTPYEVLLGRLGAEEAATRPDLRGLWAFNPVPATAEHPPGCVHIAAAQHRLCGEFRPYWEGHGLELGDPGVSFREALALFGYPISEEFIDPRTGLITQYFERARFEYHPELPAGRRILLGRLAADRLAEMGW
jgi:hypothetical protein